MRFLLVLLFVILALSYAEIDTKRWEKEFRQARLDFEDHASFRQALQPEQLMSELSLHVHPSKHATTSRSFAVFFEETYDKVESSERHQELRSLASEMDLHYRHMGDNAGVFVGTPLAVKKLEALHFVEEVLPFPSQAKLHQELDCDSASAEEPLEVVFHTAPMHENELGSLLDHFQAVLGTQGKVDFKDHEFFAGKSGKSSSSKAKGQAGRIFSLNSPQTCSAALDAIASHPSVMWVEKHYEKHVHNLYSRYTTQSGYQGSTTPIWNLGLTGEGQVVGVSDTGLDVKSCFFYDSSNTVPYDTVSSSHRKIKTYITYVDSTDPTSGHGTHVCGSVMGNAGNSYDGMAYDAKVAFYDIGDSSESLYIPTNFNKFLYQPMREAGAYIMSGSWGASTAAYNSDCYYSDQFMEDYEDSVVLYAAGNDGENGASSIGAPATAKNIIAVGAAVSSSDSWTDYGVDDSAYDGNKVAYFSSQGPTSAGLLKPDLTAPGYFIASAYSISSGSNDHCFFTWKAGTSMATPTAAGNLALIRQFLTEGYYLDQSDMTTPVSFKPTGSLLKAMLVHSTVEMDYYLDETGSSPVNTVSSRGDYYQGYGQIQLDTILSNDGSFNLFLWGATDEVNHADKVLQFNAVGQEANLTFVIDSTISMEFKATMAYTDPAIGFSDASLSNDIDLIVEYDGTTTYYPISGSGSADSNNTLEQIVISSPTVGSTVVVRVICSQLNSGPQEASLVVSGLFDSWEFDTPYVEPSTEDSASTVQRSTVLMVAVLMAAVLIFF